MKTVKQQLLLLMLALACLASVGCQSLGVGWPEEGEIVEKAFDVPREGRYWVIGTEVIIPINKDYIYWFKIKDKTGDLTWVQIDGNTFNAYDVGTHWVKIPEAKVFRYVPVKDTERGGPPQNRIIKDPAQLLRFK
jgi:hypothetical protein